MAPSRNQFDGRNVVGGIVIVEGILIGKGKVYTLFNPDESRTGVIDELVIPRTDWRTVSVTMICAYANEASLRGKSSTNGITTDKRFVVVSVT